MRFSNLAFGLLILLSIAFSLAKADSGFNTENSNNLVRRVGEAASSSSNTASTTSSAAAKATSSTSKAVQYGNFASPDILETGTLFYIGASVTTLLWITGKFIDVKCERQERYAERLAHRG